MVRDALVTSVTWALPPVRFQISQVSIVPKRSLPSSAFSRAPSTLSRIQAILEPEKYASGIRPVRALIFAAQPCFTISSIIGAVRRHCQTIAWQIGFPVARSQTIVVSRWLVMPIAAMLSAVTPSFAIASIATPYWEDQISIASCSTQPGCG